MPKLPVSDIDILFVDELGKNFSGTGMDTNVIGRFRLLGVDEPDSPNVKYLIVSDVSDASHGNATGVRARGFHHEPALREHRLPGHEPEHPDQYLCRAGESTHDPEQ